MANAETTQDQFAYYTGKAGDVARQLGFAGLALVWLLHTGAAGGEQAAVSTPFFKGFRGPIVLLVLGLAVDCLQYILGCVVWGIAFAKYPTGPAYQEKTENIIAIVIPCLLIAAKLVLVGIAYTLLLLQLRCGALWQG